MDRDLEVCGRGEAEALEGRPSWVVVSIHDPGQSPAALSPGWHAVLRLAFQDKEDEDLAAKTGLFKLFSPEQAQALVNFVQKHSSCTGVLIHCFAGASRSPAIARALASHRGRSPDPDWPRGNALVGRRMQDALRKAAAPARLVE